MNNFPPIRHAILENAILHFQEKPYKKVKLSEIAKDTGIKRKELKQYFNSKETLFRDVFLELYGRIAPQLQDIMEANMPLFEKIRHFTNEYVRFVNDYKFLPLGLITKLNVNTDFAREFIVNLTMPDPSPFYRQVEKEIQKGNIRPVNPKLLLINIFALSVFPNVASPLMKDFIHVSNEEFEQIKDQGKSKIAEFIINSIQIAPSAPDSNLFVPQSVGNSYISRSK